MIDYISIDSNIYYVVPPLLMLKVIVCGVAV